MYNTGYVQIRTDCSVGAGVTLILPYLDGTNSIGSDGSITAVYHNSDSSNTAAAERNPLLADALSKHQKKCDLGCSASPCIHEKCSFCTDSGCGLCITKVIIHSGTKLQIYGTMIISGELDGGGAGLNYTGATSGYYAEVVLEPGATLEVDGTLHVPGFITETEDGKAKVHVGEYGAVYQPFVVRDFKGGTVTGAIYNSIMDGVPYSPFNEFCTMNIYAKMEIYGSVIAYANIYANSQHNSTVAPLIGRTNSAFIQLTGNSSYAIAEFDLETEILKLDIYGGARTNSFKVSVNTPLGVKTMTSQKFIFPLCWMYDITLHSGSYNMTNGNKFKLLPGAKFTVESDATLRIDYLNIYDSFKHSDQVKSYCVRYQNIPAIFTVNGSVTATELGGKVYTTKGGASVTIISKISITTNEPYAYPSTEEVMAGVLFGSSGRVSSSSTTPIQSDLKLFYNYKTSDTEVVNIFSGALNPATRYESVENGINSNWKRSEYISITIQPGWNVTGITGALVLGSDGKPVDTNNDGAYDTYTPNASEIFEGATFYFSYSGGTITFQLADREMLMKNGNHTTTITSLPNVSGVRTETWSVTVSESISITKLPTISYSGSTSKINGSKTVTYVDNGDGTCNVSIYLETKCTGTISKKDAAAFTVTVVENGHTETYTPVDHKTQTIFGREYIESRDISILITTNATITIS